MTGHRDLQEKDIEALCGLVRSIFSELKQDYPSTPIILLSPLAEGADRLVARVALEPKIGARLLVPLPMPRSIYEEDFNTAGSLSEFTELIDQKAERWFAVPMADGATEESLGQHEVRDRQYQELGKFIARESQILIALWDGVDTGLVGGTAQVAQFQTEGVPVTEGYDLEPPEGFPVYHIVTPRKKNPSPKDPLTLRKIYPKAFREDYDEAEPYYREMFGRLDAFNRNADLPDAALAEEVSNSKRYVLSDVEEKVLPSSQRITLNRYAFADALAVRFQSRMRGAQVCLHWAVFLSFGCFVIQADLPDLFSSVLHRGALEHLPVWLYLSFGFLLIGLARYHSATRQDLDKNYQDYRAVAEGLRVKFFWGLAGVDGRVNDHYLRKARTELDWIRNGLRGWSLDPEGGQLGGREGIDLALSYWVEDQQKYFARSAKRDEDKAERLEHVVELCLTQAIVLAIVLAVTLTEPLSDGLAHAERLRDWLIVLVDLFLAGGAILHHYNERMAFAEHAKQYGRMQVIFKNAFDQVTSALGSDQTRGARECLRNLGAEALAENGDWVLLHRERPLELPHP